jgi:hypothetical protein
MVVVIALPPAVYEDSYFAASSTAFVVVCVLDEPFIYLLTSFFENSLFESCAHVFTGVLILWGAEFFEFPVDPGY